MTFKLDKWEKSEDSSLKQEPTRRQMKYFSKKINVINNFWQRARFEHRRSDPIKADRKIIKLSNIKMDKCKMQLKRMSKAVKGEKLALLRHLLNHC